MSDRRGYVDAYAPGEIAERVREAVVAKSHLDLASLLALSVLAGAFIALGACFSTLAATGATGPYGLARLPVGLAFSLGLILVVVGGAELFTGNMLVVMGWASGAVSTRALLRNWSWVYVGNFAGSVATALLIFYAGPWRAAGSQVGVTAVNIALLKCSLPAGRAFFLGIFCNVLVCLAVWLCFGARSTTDRILAIIFPITAFVALGFEHSIANMYFIPFGMLVAHEPSVVAAGGWAPDALAALNAAGFARNLLWVTLGNLVGGGFMVAGVYWFIYQRPGRRGNGAVRPGEGLAALAGHSSARIG